MNKKNITLKIIDNKKTLEIKNVDIWYFFKNDIEDRTLDVERITLTFHLETENTGVEH